MPYHATLTASSVPEHSFPNNVFAAEKVVFGVLD